MKLQTLRATLAIVALATISTMPFSAAALPNGPDGKVTICHATGSPTNPYVTIHTSENAINGHFDNNGTPLSGHEDDLLLQGDVDCPGGSNGGGGNSDSHKVTICHATESDTNPYVRIVVDSHAISGHFDNNGTPLSGHEDDILLQGDVACPGGGPGGGGNGLGVLVFQKQVVNDNGGTAVVSDFTITIANATSDAAVFGPAPAPQFGDRYFVSPGVYHVSEMASSSYVGTFSEGCDSNGNITVTAGATSTCVLTNDDVQGNGGGNGGNGGNTGVLIIKKVVVNDDGGTATSSNFTITVTNASSSQISGSPFAGSAGGSAFTVPVGAYTVSESATTTYAGSFSGACNGSGVVNVTAGATSTCVITNNDIATSTCGCGGGGGGGGGQFGLLTLIKHTQGGNGTFDFSLTGSTAATTSLTTFGGIGVRILPLLGLGTTTISEISQSGWVQTNASCMQNGFSIGTTTSGGFTFNLALGGGVVCEFYNSATTTATSTPGGGGGGGGSGATTGTIVVIKQVVGGNASSSAFSIHIKNATTTTATTSIDIAGSPQNGTTTGTIYMNVATGTYVVSETGGPGGYTSSFSGACDSNGVLAVTAGATSTCTITNTFPSNNGGGGAVGGGGGSSGLSGGGGGNGPIVGSIGGGNGPILGGGGFSPGEVLGAATSIPDGVGGYVPGVPNTGAGGAAGAYAVLLLLSALLVLSGLVSMRR